MSAKCEMKGEPEEHKATPYMKKFFNNIFAIKVMLKNQLDKNPNDKFLKEVYQKLNDTLVMNEEME